MRGAGNHRRGGAASNPPPSDPYPHRRTTFSSSRDSDASFASSRPSGVGTARSASALELYKDHRHQSAAVATINAYLSDHSQTLSLRLPFPPAKDITQTLTLLLSRLEFPSNKLEEDLPLVLKALGYPFKLNKSILKSPGTPHQWPTFLAIIHWLVQVAMLSDQMSSDTMTESFVEQNPMNGYTLQSYRHYITGDDDAVEAMDQEWAEKLERERESSLEVLKELEKTAAELGAQVEAAKTGPSRKEALEQEKAVLEEDMAKFEEIIAKLGERIAAMERDLDRKEKEIREKEEETRQICKENDELRKRVEAQTVNSRDVERMRRELQSVERDIGEAEAERNSWEEKAWDLDATLGHNLKDIESLAMECNQAMRRLKFGDGFQYTLNSQGSTPAEVMGIDYKLTLKPALESFSEDLKKSSMAKLEELISLQQQSRDIAARIEGKRTQLAKLDSHFADLETQMQLFRNETKEHTSRCSAEAKNLVENVEMESHNLGILEQEAAEVLKESKLKLQEAIKQCEEETQLCAGELMKLVDKISKHKEHVQSKILQMKSAVSQTAFAISEVHKNSLQAQIDAVFNANK